MKKGVLFLLLFLIFLLSSCSKNKQDDLDLIPLQINPLNEELSYAYVEKQALVDYINSTDSHRFYYEDFKEKVGFAIDARFDGYGYFNEEGLAECVDENYHRIVIDKSGKVIVKDPDKAIESTRLLGDDKILASNADEEYFLYDKNGELIEELGKSSYPYIYQNIIRLSKMEDESADKEKYRYYDINLEKFIEKPKYFSEMQSLFNNLYNDLYEDLKGSSFKIETSPDLVYDNSAKLIISNESGKKVEMKMPSLEGEYLVSRENYSDPIRVYDENLDEIFEGEFADFYYLGDGYYGCAKYSDELESIYEIRSSENGWQDYRIDAIFDGENFTDFKYFIIRYLGDDLFYFFEDGEFYFYNFKKGERVFADVLELFNIDDFKVYDDLIVGRSLNDGQILITDKNYMITSKHYKLGGVEIFTEHRNDELLTGEYPRIKMENKEVESKINKYIKTEFFADSLCLYDDEKNKRAVDYTYDLYFSSSLFRDKILVIDEGIFWYGFGSRGYQFDTKLNFDLETGERLSLDSIFKDKDRAMDFIYKRIWEQTVGGAVHIPLTYVLKEEEYSLERAKEGFEEDMDFYFDDENFNIFYSQGRIAPYTVGGVYYEIPYSEMKEYFRYDLVEKLDL